MIKKKVISFLFIQKAMWPLYELWKPDHHIHMWILPLTVALNYKYTEVSAFVCYTALRFPVTGTKYKVKARPVKAQQCPGAQNKFHKDMVLSF